MKDINKMMKCRAIFLYSIGLIYEDFSILNDERLSILLESFLDDFVESNFESLNLIYYFKSDNEDNLYVYEEEEWHQLLTKYLNYFAYKDTKNIIKIYDEIGKDNIDKINYLVELFYRYK